jgi:hypothetical protein
LAEKVQVDVEMRPIWGAGMEGKKYIHFKRLSGDPFIFSEFYRTADSAFLSKFQDAQI